MSVQSEPAVDAVTREVLYYGLLTTTAEMSAVLGRSAYSPIIREMIDYSCALFDPGGELVAQAENIPSHLGSMGQALREIISEYGSDFPPGDAYITNDPYRGGTHTPDIHVFTPAFVDDELVAIAGTIAHHTDVGGPNPGSEGFDLRSIYGEGLRIPPLRLARAGALDPTISAVIATNVREPESTLGDIRAQIAACRFAERRVAEFAQRYGADRILAVAAALMDYSEERMRIRLSELEDGEACATGYLDDDGLGGRDVEIKVLVRVAGDRITVDFTGTADQMPGGMNVPPAAARSAVMYAVKTVVDPETPQNEGCARPVSLVLPEGSVVRPRFPAAVSLRHPSVLRIADTILRAMCELYPERTAAGSFVGFSCVTCEGRDDVTGELKVAADCLGGGLGAHANGDGLDAVDPHLGNIAILPAEICEPTYGLRILATELIPDSGGAGKFRGGLGFRRIYEVVGHEQTGLVYTEQTDPRFAPWGHDGGENGAAARILIQRAGGKVAESRKGYFRATPGDRIVIETGGGGGWGDPHARERQLVARDLTEGKISAEAARAIYGPCSGEDLAKA